MYAVAIEGELLASALALGQVAKLVQAELREGQRKIEVASFDGRLWIPVCVDRFILPLAA